MSNTAREQFVNDYLLVADNDYTAHKILMGTAARMDKWELSESLRDSFYETVGRVQEVLFASRQFSEFERLLVAQLLTGWGQDVFDDIASALKEREGELRD